MFPICLQLRDRLCLVVGGGPVGRRKSAALLEAGATVRLVCLESPTLLETERQPQWLQERYSDEHLAGVALAFAAATESVNRKVAADAKARGIWVNLADDPEGSSFHLPAVVRRGELLIAVSTGGEAPALAKAIRTHLEEEFDEAFGAWLQLAGELRPAILRIHDAATREQLFALVTQWDWIDKIRSDGIAAVRIALAAEVQRCTGH